MYDDQVTTAVILCGGKGSRLGDVTGTEIPKPMVRIGGQPILFHIMNYYSKFGVNHFILCAGHKSWKIKEFFLDYDRAQSDLLIDYESGTIEVSENDNLKLDWKIQICETGEETQTAGRLKRIRKYLPSGPFMLTYGDGVSNVDLFALQKFHAGHSGEVTITGVTPPGRFGELIIEGDAITEWAEKPSVTDRYINGGFMCMEPSFIDKYIELDSDAVMLEHEPLERASAARTLYFYKHTGFWQCMDNPRDYAQLNSMYAKGELDWLT